MLIDATVLTSDRLTAEICIVGTGMGGTSVAKRLVEAKADVLLVEAGGDRRDRSKAALVQYQPAGMSFGLPLTRVMEIGGGTNAWHGICAPLIFIDFEHRDWIPRSGWPISRNDLERYYSEARTWLEVGTTLRDTIEDCSGGDAEHVADPHPQAFLDLPDTGPDAEDYFAVDFRKAGCAASCTRLAFN